MELVKESLFKKARYTAIVSDMHLCEAQPINPKFPLWKKYKTREFFFDEVFKDFLAHLEARAKGGEIELILNGDIFDFDSVTQLPEHPYFRMSWLEKLRGLYPQEEKSKFKIETILEAHDGWVKALRDFIFKGHRAIFIIGNHDLELHYPEVQAAIIEALDLPPDLQEKVRFCEWFYISNQDTLIEHGNQYDPYCMCEDPIHPYIQRYNHREVKLPFGNLACRYMLNGMGFFNPHVDTNYIMTMGAYIKFFFKYIIRAQPLLVWTWFWGALVTLVQSFSDRLADKIREPLRIEDKINRIAEKSNADPRMVRELKELFVAPAASNPFLLARELWLDRAFLILMTFYVLALIFLFIRQVYEISFFWMFIPLFLMLPFFLFYSQSITSLVSSYKEPREDILTLASLIAKVGRIVYGHTHQTRHEVIGTVEHLNSGCWSPAFLDIECTQPIDQKTFVWIYPDSEAVQRKAELLKFENGRSVAVGRKLSRRTQSKS